MPWGPCGRFKFSSYGQLQVSFIAESPGLEVLFLTTCRAVFLSHVLPSPTLLTCATRCPAAQPALPPCCPTPCHSSPALSLPHFLPFCLSTSPSPFPANPLLSHSRLPEVLTSFFSEMGSGKPTYYHTESSGKNPVTSSPPFLPSSFCLSWLLFSLLLNCKLFEGSAGILSIEFHKAPNTLNIVKGSILIFLLLIFNKLTENPSKQHSSVDRHTCPVNRKFLLHNFSGSPGKLNAVGFIFLTAN